ncbi:MAG: FtsX-like permease family protein [Prolixibacteraceae bacterium]|nr:FtsX-like permease family protein [Prolixibacteraceae bacterium]
MINIISLISMVGLAVGAFALVTTISVFNGFDDLIQSRFSSFDPPLKVVPVEGKVFDTSTVPMDKIKSIPGVIDFSQTIEDNALLRYGNKQLIATVKGVDSLFLQNSDVSSMMKEGKAKLKIKSKDAIILGGMVASNLKVGIRYLRPVNLYFPKRSKSLSINIAQSFRHKLAYASGTFSIQAEIDDKYVLVPLEMARGLMGRKSNEVSQLEIYIDKSADESLIKKRLEEMMGPSFKVLNRYEQHDTYFKIMKGEKWAIFLILVFILFVASFNLIGSISMLMIDKKEDIAILQSMGAPNRLIRRIFLYEGWLISVCGAIIGLSLGIIVCYLQQEFGFVKLQGGGAFIVSSYPVKLIFSDISIIALTVTLLGLFSSWIPIRFLKFNEVQV